MEPQKCWLCRMKLTVFSQEAVILVASKLKQLFLRRKIDVFFGWGAIGAICTCEMWEQGCTLIWIRDGGWGGGVVKIVLSNDTLRLVHSHPPSHNINTILHGRIMRKM